MAVFWLIPGGSVGLIPAAAVFPLVIHATEMEGGGGGGVDGDLSPTAGGLIPSGVTVLKKYQGGSVSNPGRANCSREDSRWCSVMSNTRKGSSNPGGELVLPGIDPSGVTSRLLLFIAGHLFVYSMGMLNHTSDLAAASAWVACKRPSSGCDGVFSADV